MKYPLIIIVAILAFITAAVDPGLAQTNNVKIAFKAADTNADGKITLDEFKNNAKQETFSNIDRNRDGKIDKAEWQAADITPQAEATFEAADKDRDKTVNLLEFSDHVGPMRNYDEVFNALDRNRDGSLAPDEFNARPAFTILSVKF